MKSRLPLLLIIVIVIAGGLYLSFANNRPELRVLIWDNYLAPDTISNFEVRENANVVLELFKSNEEALAKIKANPGVYDIVVPSDYMVNILRTENLLTTLNASVIPNSKNIANAFRNAYYDPTNQVSVPYAYGTAGFAVNTTFVPDTSITWQTLTEERFKGKILLMDDMRYVLGSVLIELGYSPNTTTQSELDAAVALLQSVMKNVQKITPDTPVDLMVAEGAWVAYGYSGDIFQMNAENSAIVYQLPTAGALQFVDALVVPKNAPNQALAFAFINYILDPQVSADITKATNYGNPNDAAKALLPKELLANSSVFITPEQAKNLQFILDLGDAIEIYDEAWQNVKSNS